MKQTLKLIKIIPYFIIVSSCIKRFGQKVNVQVIHLLSKIYFIVFECVEFLISAILWPLIFKLYKLHNGLLVTEV